MSWVLEIAILVLSLATLSIGFRQWRTEHLAFEIAPALGAVEKFFSDEIALVRYRLYDLICECAKAAQAKNPTPRQSMLRQQFGLNQDSSQFPSRSSILNRWADEPVTDPEIKALRDEFRELSAILSATFDSLFRTAEFSGPAARHIRERVGRLLVWWMLVWPGAFDHTGSFIGRQFIRDANVRNYPPNTSNAYLPRFRETPLWSQDDWDGAIENFRSLQETMFPSDPFIKDDYMSSSGTG